MAGLRLAYDADWRWEELLGKGALRECTSGIYGLCRAGRQV